MGFTATLQLQIAHKLGFVSIRQYWWHRDRIEGHNRVAMLLSSIVTCGSASSTRSTSTSMSVNSKVTSDIATFQMSHQLQNFTTCPDVPNKFRCRYRCSSVHKYILALDLSNTSLSSLSTRLAICVGIYLKKSLLNVTNY